MSRSLFPFDCELKIIETTDSLSNSAPGRPDTFRAPCVERLEGPNIIETLLAAACLLLNASEFGRPSWTGGNQGGVVWAILVAVRDVDRRVLRIHVAEEVGKLGLATCVWA